ncbi:phosphoribosyl-ATP pyrophosphatase [Paenibacillus swuensis]|uniref:Histidine biosynthesis bifunctional protein HisIE n=1 Tax=Paenibacillus swuensis TaxID=1178515 RepID=A0A172TIH3_9BACL|nr:bifunctional phosphoribosyl-AMP cyclohydrolase/phosphoribosyl-ATP diphosphatase HisIE [Paenibacillus swuensis]ANE46838.1 phosphoribosyl-ATP pyrophosphatase [Paenibacillus swuensis]
MKVDGMGLSAELKWDAHGLMPAIVQDAASKEVLMLAYMNEESLKLSVESGETWFWSRSRKALWHKGATSGNTQHILSMKYDCDADTLLVLVEPQGPACHTGKYTCFNEEVALAGAGEGLDAQKTSGIADGGMTALSGQGRFEILGELERLIAEREAERPEGAYTTYLFDKGVDKILKKVGEEAAEVIIAAKNRDKDELRYEASDLIYHLLVLLREQKLPLDDVLRELGNRHNKVKPESQES